MFTYVYPCLLVLTYVYSCLPIFALFTRACLLIFTKVYSFLPMFTHCNLYLPLFTSVYLLYMCWTYLPVFTHFTYVYGFLLVLGFISTHDTRVYVFLHLFKYVCHCLLLFTHFYRCLLVLVTYVYPCWLEFIYVYTFFYLSLPLLNIFTSVCTRLPKFNTVYWCLSMFTPV